MAAIQTQILQDSFDNLSNNMSVNHVHNRGQQMNGLASSNNNPGMTIQSPTGFIQQKSPARVININPGNVGQSQSDAQNPRSGWYCF